jgi:HEPN domain-containing protein
MWNDPEADLLDAAASFLKAADRCLSGSRAEPGVEMLTVPGAMCAAFACELYLKFIHLKANGESPRGHDLAVLFDHLDEATRRSLIARRPDIAEAFERNRGQFVEVRYHHEKEQVSFRQQELLQLAETLADEVRDRYGLGAPGSQ